MAEHNELGIQGEEIARNHLLEKGYLIKHANWRFGSDEIDIIAVKNNCLVIVEEGALNELKGPMNPNAMQSYYNPYKILLDIYEAKGDYQKALNILNQLDEKDPSVSLKKKKIMDKMSGKQEIMEPPSDTSK